MTTGMGWPRISFSRNVRPSIRGISISRVSTSGWRALIFSRATKGSAAVPITSSSGSELRICVSNWRMSDESSTISTLYGERICTVPSRLQSKITSESSGTQPPRTGHLFGIGTAVELFHQNHKPGRLARERLRCFSKLFRLRGVSLRNAVDLRHGSCSPGPRRCSARQTRSRSGPPSGPCL